MNRTSAPRSEGEQTDLLRVAYKGRYLIAIGLLLGLGLGYLNHRRSEVEYSSTAQLLIKSKTSAPIPVDGTTASRDTTDIITHAAVLESPILIDKAIRKYELPALGKMGADDLVIEPREGSDAILDVSFRCNDRQECADVVNGLIDTFSDFYGEMDQQVGSEMLGLVKEANTVLAKQLQERQREYDKFRQSSPLIDRAGNSLNLHQERMLGIEQERAGLELQVNALDVEISTIEKAFAMGMDVNAIRILAEQISGKSSNPGLTDPANGGSISHSALSNQLLPLLIEFQSLEDRYGSDHPDVLAMKKQIDLLKGLDPNVTDDDLAVSFEDFTRADLKSHLTARKAVREAKRRELASLSSMFVKEQEGARSLISVQVEHNDLKNRLNRTQKLFDTVMRRLDEVSLTKDHGGYNIEVLARAEPGRVVSPGLAEQLIRGGLLGLLAGFGIAYFAVGKDVRFTDIKEVSGVLEVPIMGAISNFDQHITDVDNDELGVAASVQAFHRPKSSISEGYRGIRTGLYFAMENRRRIVQVTSPLPGEGKSTLTANLAVSIAASGKRVLVIDGDMRRPRQHQLLAPNIEFNGNGLSRVLSGEAPLNECIFKTDVPNLSLLPCGAIPENPAELLVSGKTDELLARLAEEYDFVLVDSPPMLAVSDPSSIATRVDGVLMTFNLAKTARQAVVRARELLQKIDAEIVGVVVNQVATKKDGKFGSMYGYGNYGYNNSYYGYGEYHYDTRHSDTTVKPKALEKKERTDTSENIGV